MYLAGVAMQRMQHVLSHCTGSQVQGDPCAQRECLQQVIILWAWARCVHRMQVTHQQVLQAHCPAHSLNVACYAWSMGIVLFKCTAGYQGILQAVVWSSTHSSFVGSRPFSQVQGKLALQPRPCMLCAAVEYGHGPASQAVTTCTGLASAGLLLKGLPIAGSSTAAAGVMWSARGLPPRQGHPVLHCWLLAVGKGSGLQLTAVQARQLG